MSEPYLARALRGIGNALRMTGSGRVAPPGVQLRTAMQVVMDASPFAIYGGALEKSVGDGWWTGSLEDDTPAATGTFSNDLNPFNLSGCPAGNEDKVAWIYGAFLKITFGDNTESDFDVAQILLTMPDEVNFGASASQPMLVWLGLSTVSTAAGTSVAQVRQTSEGLGGGRMVTPLPCFRESTVDARVTFDAKSGTDPFELDWSVICRFLPAGIPPVP